MWQSTCLACLSILNISSCAPASFQLELSGSPNSKWKHMLRKYAILCNTIVAFIVLPSAMAVADGILPLWESRGVVGAANDTFYTTYLNEHVSTTTGAGYAEHGVAAFIPCAVNGLLGPNGETPNAYNATQDQYHGYPTADMDFPCAQPGSSTALYRFYKGPPQNDHVYITSASEATSLKAIGYRFDRVEGYVLTTNVFGGVVLLHRLSLGTNVPNQEVDHRYTVSDIARQGLINAGWKDEGSVGWVYTSDPTSSVNATGYSGHFNGSTVTATGSVNVSIKNVTPPAAQYNLDLGYYASNVTSRPIGAVWQQISFTFYTGDMFGSSTFNHWPIYLHYASTPTKTDLSFAGLYDGIALVISTANIILTSGSCASSSTTGQLYIELASGRALVPGGGANLLCDPRLSTPLQNLTSYDVSFQLNDSAQVKLSVKQHISSPPFLVPLTFANMPAGTTIFSESLLPYYRCPLTYTSLTPDQSYCANPASLDGFKADNTGYVSHPLFSGSDNGPLVSNMTMHWLDANGNVLN
jgi:uncharacterized protein DUF5648